MGWHEATLASHKRLGQQATLSSTLNSLPNDFIPTSQSLASPTLLHLLPVMHFRGTPQALSCPSSNCRSHTRRLTLACKPAPTSSRTDTLCSEFADAAQASIRTVASSAYLPAIFGLHICWSLSSNTASPQLRAFQYCFVSISLP